jgi:putative MATE family efflux protein
MTEGVIWRKLVSFSVPLLIGNVVQQLYNTVDAIVVGRYVGDSALAAVGSSFSLMMLLLVLFMGISTGAGIMVSQYFGAKDRESLARTIGSSLTLTFLSSMLMTAIGVIAINPILKLLNTPDDVIVMCAEYMTIIFIGISGISFYNMISGILRGIGDAFMPLVFLVITCVINTVLDIWFVAGLGWGVAGAAWATVIAQWISSILCVIRLLNMKEACTLHLRHLKIDKNVCVKLASLGLPAAFTQMIFSLANVVVQSLTNSFGTTIIAASTAVMRVDGFAMMPNFTFGMAIATFVGQNVGAGRMDRVKASTKPALAMGVGVSATMVTGILIFGKQLAGVFTSTEAIVNQSYIMLCILAVGYIAIAVTQILSGSMRGAGDTVSPMWISLISTVIIRTPLAYLLAYLTRSPEYPVGRPETLYVSLLTAWVLGAVTTAVLFKRGKWLNKAIVKRQEPEQEIQAQAPPALGVLNQPVPQTEGN